MEDQELINKLLNATTTRPLDWYQQRTSYLHFPFVFRHCKVIQNFLTNHSLPWHVLWTDLCPWFHHGTRLSLQRGFI